MKIESEVKVYKEMPVLLGEEGETEWVYIGNKKAMLWALVRWETIKLQKNLKGLSESAQTLASKITTPEAKGGYNHGSTS